MTFIETTALMSRPLREGIELMDVERNDIPLQLWGELDVGGYDITGVYLPDSSVNIIGLFNHHQISEFEDYCDEHLQTWEEQQTDMRQDVLFQQRRDARL